MIQVSEEFRKAMDERRDFRCCGEVTLADGSELVLTEDDLTLSGNSVTDGAGDQRLPLGTAVSRTAVVEIMNDDGHLDGYDFFGARLRLWLVFALAETEERIDFGRFTVLEPETWGETVTVSACDDMYRADKPYVTDLPFPATLGTMFRDICERCDIPYSTAAFPHQDFAVASPPDGEMTFRQVLGYIAMLAGGNARVSRDGRMEILAYDFSRAPDHVLAAWDSLKTDTDDILITGLETTVTGTDETGRTVRTRVLEGEEGYVLCLENPLFAGEERQALALIGQGLIGARFRRFSGEHAAYPMAEFMDTASVVDRKGNAYATVLTDVDFVFCGSTALANSAEPAIRSSSRYVTPEVKARIAARELVEREKTERETAMERLAGLLSQSGGLFSTEQTLEDGSHIYYLHNKPTMAGSSNIIKLTADAIGLSLDGGATWPYGFTVTGEMVMGIIQAEGLNADWVRFGTLARERVEGLDEMAASFQVLQERIESKVWQTDIDEAVDSASQTTMEQVVSMVQDSEGIIMEAMQEYARTSDLDSFRESVRAQLGVLADQVVVEVARLTEEQRAINDDLQGKYAGLIKYYRFTADGLEIGDSASQLILRLTNDRLAFLDNGQEVAYISDRKLYITDAHLLNSLRVGNFAWVPRSNGNLSLVRMD